MLGLILKLPPVSPSFSGTRSSRAIARTAGFLINQDATPAAERFVGCSARTTRLPGANRRPPRNEDDLLRQGVRAALVIPSGWSESLTNGDPIPLRLSLDGSDTSTGEQLLGSLHKTLGDFQMNEREVMIDALPDEVIDMAKKLPVEVRKQFVSAMTPWKIEEKILYNPEERFIDYVLPGVIGIILQLITVTLMACTIARERESGTLYQLMATSLRRGEIVIGKILPYLAISIFLILVSSCWPAGISGKIYQPGALAPHCFLFLLCSLGLGLLISAL